MILSAVHATVYRLVRIPPRPTAFSDFSDFEWPTVTSIWASQDRFSMIRPSHAADSGGFWRLFSDKIWVPDDDDALQLRFCPVAQTGAAGHRGPSTTKNALAMHFFWSTLSENVCLFVCFCIHSLSTTGR